MMRRLIWVIPAVALLALVGWRVFSKEAAAAQLSTQMAQRRKAGPRVELAAAKPTPIEQTVEAVGSVESPFVVKLSAKTPGTIDMLQVREGDDVKPGQVLVMIDPSDLKGQVYQQAAAVAQARAKLAQAAITQGSNDTSVQAQISQMKAGLDSAGADYSQVRQNYSAQVAAAEAQVTDGQAKVAAAAAGVDVAKADVASAQASYNDANTKLARMESLFKQQFVAAQDVDDARAAMQVQKAALDASKQRLSAANSALNSAKALMDAAAKQASIVKTKGLSDIEASRARLRQATASYAVARANRSQTPAYKENLAALRADVAAANGQLSSAKAKLSDTTLRSTIEGTVTTRSADPGTVVTTGQQILTIQYLKWLYVNVSVPIEESAAVVKGQKTVIRFDALPGKTFQGAVDEINAAADPQNRQFTVRVRIDNPARSIKPGMYGRVQIVVGTIDAKVTVPREAVVREGDDEVVYVIGDDRKAHRRVVKLGVTNGPVYEIKSGLEDGEQVAVLSYVSLKDGQTVNVGGPQVERGTK